MMRICVNQKLRRAAHSEASYKPERLPKTCLTDIINIPAYMGQLY